MLKSHEKFHSANGKRLILVVDDEYVDRELLRNVLQDDYELIFAENGEEALGTMHELNETLSLVLLDLMMPVLNGMDVLRKAKTDPTISHLPIIVITSDQDAEIESLTMGAIDFIPKPYPQAGVIRARVRRTIELAEDRQIISFTERDVITGLYNREYFYKYVEQYDRHHRDVEMDAMVIDINHFRLINERLGSVHADSILRRIGETLREMMQDVGGFVCRKEADTFMLYCPHGESYEALLDRASIALSEEESDDSRVWLRMGVYANVDKGLVVERRFDRAKMAADTVQGSFTRRIGLYDDKMHEQELYSEQLIADFPNAIKERQFQVYYQPKFDIGPEVPALASAEALVRWAHPELGMITPNDFIPLFENNGLIQKLDTYVWREATRQVGEWRERFGFTVPVSVNVSRIDMHDPHLVETVLEIIEESGIDPYELLLEITESAYTQDSEQIIEMVERFRSLGLRVEMDDFGTGYSSLNMISTLPIDALKLDMQFIRNAFSGRRDTRMLEIIIDIAEYLSVPVIAEGVETEDQLVALKEMGCDFVQGYYFSQPVPAEQFEAFLLERKKTIDVLPIDWRGGRGEGRRKERLPFSKERRSSVLFGSVTRALAADYFGIYYVNIEDDRFIGYKPSERRNDFDVERRGDDFFGLLRETMMSVVHPDDAPLFLSRFTKDNVLSKLGRDGSFDLTFRLVLDGSPTYVTMKATQMEDEADRSHIVVGISNVDEQVREGRERGKSMLVAGRDELTSVKNGQAFHIVEEELDGAICEGSAEPFAVAVCDVVGVPDDAPMAGGADDQRIKDGCAIVCVVFKHSPVFRVAANRFVVLLKGGDYDSRIALMERLVEDGESRKSNGGALIVGGLATYRPDDDAEVSSVFARARDAALEAGRTR